MTDETDVNNPYGTNPCNFRIDINKCIVPVIDMVGCFANTNSNYKSFMNNNTGTYTQVNTYNPNGKTIWFWQTNEALGKKIPDSIENKDQNSGGEPGNLFKGLFYSIWY